MERNEMIEVLMEKAKVSREEAEEVLENCNWDLLDSIVYLERKGKVENKSSRTIIKEDIKKDNSGNQEHSKNHEEECGGISDILSRIARFIGKTIRLGKQSKFKIRKNNEKPINISLILGVFLLIVLFVPTSILLVVGLFCGYKYSIEGPAVNYSGVNDIFEDVSNSAENVKKDFKKGYEN